MYHLEKTLEAYLVKYGVSQKRRDGIRKRIVKNRLNLEVCDYLMDEDGMIGIIWRDMVNRVTKNLDQLKIGRDKPVLTIVERDGRWTRHFTLPTGWTGERFKKFLDTYREVLDYWYEKAVEVRQ